MKTWVVHCGTAWFVSGCGPSGPEAKQQAYEQWDAARAKVLYGVAREHLAVGQLERARIKATEALSLQQDYRAARILLAKVYIEQGRYRQAIGELNRALEQNASLPADGGQDQAAELYYLLGAAQEKAGLLADALESYRRCQTIETSNVAPVMAAAEVLVAMKRLREAQLYVESYLSLADSARGMYELAGRIAMMQEDYPRGAGFYQQACDLAPKNIRYREALAACEFHAGRHRAALEALQGLTKSPGYKTPAWVHVMIGDCQIGLGRPYEARDSYYAASELKPSEAGIWANLAKADLALGDAPRAILASHHALKLDPASLDAAMLVGYALLKDGQVPRAVAVLTRGAASHPRSATMQCLLGRAYAAQGKGAEAVRCYAAALRAEPENQLAKELLAGQRDGNATKLE